MKARRLLLITNLVGLIGTICLVVVIYKTSSVGFERIDEGIRREIEQSSSLEDSRGIAYRAITLFQIQQKARNSSFRSIALLSMLISTAYCINVFLILGMPGVSPRKKDTTDESRIT